jgi:hypothetical protein
MTLCNLVTLITGISMSAVATNGQIKVFSTPFTPSKNLPEEYRYQEINGGQCYGYSIRSVADPDPGSGAFLPPGSGMLLKIC